MRRIKALSLTIIGTICLVVGIVMTPLPPPFAFGIYLIALGLLMLAAGSKRARRTLQHLRYKYPKISEKLEKVTPRLPRLLGKIMHSTNPQALYRKLKRKRRLKERGKGHDHNPEQNQSPRKKQRPGISL